MFPHHRIGRIVCLVLAATLATAAGCARSSDRDTAQAADKVYRAMTGAPEPSPAKPAPVAAAPAPEAPAAAKAAIVIAAPAAPVPEAPPAVPPVYSPGAKSAPVAPLPPEAVPPSPAATGTPGPTSPPPPPPPTAAGGAVRLTMAEFLRRTLAGNPDIQIAGYGPPEAREDIIVAKAVFDPVVFGSSTAGRTDRPTQSTLDTGVTAETDLVQSTWSFQGGVRDKIPTGGTFAVYQSSDYVDTNSVFTVPNPQYSTRLTFEFSQPLLRSGGVDYNRAAIRVATLNSDISVQDFRKGVTDVIATAISAYWQLLFDLEAVRVSQASLDLAAEVMRREKAHLTLGVSSEVDLHRAEAAVALRQADVVRAQNQTRDDMDKLKLLMNSADLPLSGDTLIVPTETPRFYLADVNRAEAIATALAHRPELERARNAIAIQRIRVDVADADRLPVLNATLRYILNGLGKAFRQGIDQQSFTELNTWSAELEFELPIGNRSADATHRRQAAGVRPVDHRPGPPGRAGHPGGQRGGAGGAPGEAGGRGHPRGHLRLLAAGPGRAATLRTRPDHQRRTLAGPGNPGHRPARLPEGPPELQPGPGLPGPGRGRHTRKPGHRGLQARGADPAIRGRSACVRRLRSNPCRRPASG